MNKSVDDYARQGDVAVESKRHSVHELCRVRDEGEQGDSEELFVDARTLEDDIDDVDKYLCERKNR
jgi:hypothetical protein